MNVLLDDDLTGPRPPVFWGALRTALGRAPIWLLCWIVPFVFAFALAAPWRASFAGFLDHHYAPGSLRLSLDEGFRFDHREELGALKSSTAGTAAALALLTMLFGVFAGGGWLQVFLERTQGHSLRRFLWGGSRYFWRFARVWILTLLSLALFSWIVYGWPWKLVMRVCFGAADGDLEVVRSEWSAFLVGLFQDGLYGVLVALLFAWGDYTRTRLALQDAFSALWAGLCTWGLFVRHPVRVLRPMLLLFGIEAGVVFALGTFSHGISRELGSETGLGTLLGMFALGQAALLLRGLLRGARYHAAAQVSKQLVPPAAEVDPWADRVGGPGGPQYPIDWADDYGVSV